MHFICVKKVHARNKRRVSLIHEILSSHSLVFGSLVFMVLYLTHLFPPKWHLIILSLKFIFPDRTAFPTVKPKQSTDAFK